jgi:hypothetical protein
VTTSTSPTASISITTIPTAAYIGAAAALQGYQDARGGLLVLGTDVAGILSASTVNIWLQRRWRPMAEADSSDRGDAPGRSG